MVHPGFAAVSLAEASQAGAARSVQRIPAVWLMSGPPAAHFVPYITIDGVDGSVRMVVSIFPAVTVGCDPGGGEPEGMRESRAGDPPRLSDASHRLESLTQEGPPAYPDPVALRGGAGTEVLARNLMGVLFEISIVCHVLCSWLVGGWRFSGCLLFCAWLSFLSLVWWLRGLGVWPGLLLVGGLGVAWLFCWGWVCPAWPPCGGGWVWVGVCSPLFGCGFLVVVLFGEFDPGSGRTLAACLTHASRTGLSSFLGVG